jgi:large subunit ribosomal protein L5
MAKLKEEYKSRIAGELEQKLGCKNKMLIPRLMKVVVNMAFGIVSKDEQKTLVEELQTVTGQRPMLCKAKKSISNFKLREGMVIGAKVTLRGDRMWEFVERLVTVALPRIRDFRGVSNRGFDGRGNYTLGLKEHSIFPELVETGSGPSGMDITFVTSTTDNKAAKELLVSMGMPFAGRN